MSQLKAEKEDVSVKLSAEVEQLRAEVMGVERDRDEQLLVAENDRQQVYTRSFHSCNKRRNKIKKKR